MRKGEEEELQAAKRGYKAANLEGNRKEEARWANVVGDLYKCRGEYVKALEWLRIDYDISSKHLNSKQLLPTCQSIGELYLRLDQFNEALIYQKKHLDLAKDSDDLIEQQRACTQLGRTYHEIFMRSENDHYAIRNAKKYFVLAMKLARTLKENAHCKSSAFFVKEYIDSHNNIGMLELDLDNLEESERILFQGLKICDDEEVPENDDARSRLHHNLGNVYLEMRDWNKARIHIEKDILICKKINHPQGEAKGYINLGELHYRVQKYDDAIRCYHKAYDIAKRMEDEDALVDQIKQNIRTVELAGKVLEELKKDEQKLKKLTRATNDARGTPKERKCLLEKNACLDGLIEKCATIFAWHKHREFAKRKKRVAHELCDKEKLADSFLVIGEAYQKLRKFNKARKWYMKSWNASRSIGNLEGQALAKINIGEVLDSLGDWAGALQAFEEGYRLATDGNLTSVKLSAIENMHYSHMIRFDNVEEARKLQKDIQSLRQLLQKKDFLSSHIDDYCSETETEGVDFFYNSPNSCGLLNKNNFFMSKTDLLSSSDEFDDGTPLFSLLPQAKKSSCNLKMSGLSSVPKNLADTTSKDLSKSDDCQPSSRKRLRVVISDDEADNDCELVQSQKFNDSSIVDMAISNGVNEVDERVAAHIQLPKDVNNQSDSKAELYSCAPINDLERTSSSFRSNGPSLDDNIIECGSSRATNQPSSLRVSANGCTLPDGSNSGNHLRSHTGDRSHQTKVDCGKTVKFRIENDFVHVDLACVDHGCLDIANLKTELACMYYLREAEHKRSKGLLPVISGFKCSGSDLCSFEAVRDCKYFDSEQDWIEVVIDGWILKPLMKSYIDNCETFRETPNKKLLKKLYNLEISEDEIVLSDCGLQDLSIVPFLHALEVQKTVAVLDVSHNLLGNETMEKLKQILTSLIQKYGGLSLDLHSNRFGPSSLFQICESPIILARLEVLNLSENRLTDACSSYISTILEKSKALYSLKLEQCSITSRTIEKLADSLHDGLVLSHLFLGKNGPISVQAMTSLLSKLQPLKRFSELSLAGIKLKKPMVDALCHFSGAGSLTSLLLGETQIGDDATLRLTAALSNRDEMMKLHLSSCGLTSSLSAQICANIASIGSLVELDLSGNSLGQEGCKALSALLMDRRCCFRLLLLDNCHLGISGMVQLLHALSENDSLEELHLAGNAESPPPETSVRIDPAASGGEKCATNMEVADSDEDDKVNKPNPSERESSCASSCQRTGVKVRCLSVEELSAAISDAGRLRVLDLSGNGFCDEVVEELYSSWSLSGLRCGAARKHVGKSGGGGGVVHFSVEGRVCCGLKPCCRKE